MKARGNQSPESVVKEIRRNTRRQYTPEEKNLIVLEGLKGESSIAEHDGARGRTVFEAAHRNPRITIYWHLDGDYPGSTVDIHQMSLAPKPGEHRLVLVDEDGERSKRLFTVLITN